jgi:hypothetical protein
MDTKKMQFVTSTGLWRFLVSKPMKFVLSTLLGGFGMWVTAGLWHNLILPKIDSSVQAHHDGLALMLISYFILASFIAYIYSISYKGGKSVIEGLKIGVVIGILWVFPHGLTMAGAHNTSIAYEINNAMYHMVEQGIGGIIIAIILGKNIANTQLIR